MAEIGNVKKVDIEKLIPYVNNAKEHSDSQVTKIAASIREFGFLNPVLIDKDFNIIAGHGRVMAAKKLEWKEVPCIFIEGLSEAQRKAYILADNRLGELADWDMELVMSELELLNELNFDIDLTGFELPSLEEESEIIEDEIPEEVETRCQEGDIWQLGNHRLICGDSTDVAVIERLMNGQKADLLLTDPPYNVALGCKGVYEAQKRHRRTDGAFIINDNMEDSEFYEFLLKFYTAAFENLKAGASFYIWHADNEGLNFRKALKDAGGVLRQTLIWKKNAITLGRQDYQWKHEPCLYGWKDGASHSWYSDRSQSTVMEFNKPSKSELHPTMKPVELIAYQIKCSSKAEDIVLDCFGGSGTTMIACEQLNRNCYMCELDPKYADVIIQRWENLTGKEAVKL